MACLIGPGRIACAQRDLLKKELVRSNSQYFRGWWGREKQDRPSLTPARLMPRTQQASGSISVAASNATSSGKSNTSSRTLAAGTRINSASPPGYRRVERNVIHCENDPRRQKWQTIQGT